MANRFSGIANVLQGNVAPGQTSTPDAVLVVGGAVGALAEKRITAAVMGTTVASALSQVGLRYAAGGGWYVRGMLIWPVGPAPQEEQLTVSLSSEMSGKVGPAPAQPFGSLVFPMNPEELRDTHRPEYARHQVIGQNRPMFQFVSGGTREIEFSLHFFYADRNRQVIRQKIETLQALTQRQMTGDEALNAGANGGAPPVYFFFGQYYQNVRCLVESVQVRAFDLFDPATLLPLRATVDLRLTEAPDQRVRVPYAAKDTAGSLGTIFKQVL